MERAIPVVRDDTLIWRSGEQSHCITVGSESWYDWLAAATAFSFSSSQGTFTARKERFQRGGYYWKAYRSRAGKLRSAYLGKSESLTSDRLNEVAAMLAASAQGDSSAPREPAGSSSRRGAAADSSISMDSVTSLGLQMLGQPSGIGQLGSFATNKFSVPPDSPKLVPRPRLIQLLHEGVGLKLTLISAPTGSGKTALLSHWSHMTLCPVVWVSLDPEDDDPLRFWFRVIAALQTTCPGIGDDVLVWLRSAQTPATEAILTRLINYISAGADDQILILDDYHVIESSAVHAGMTFLLDRLPPNMHLIIASRIGPPLPIARLRGKGQLMELRAADLSFTLEEATAFLNEVMGLDLSSEDVAVLHDRTEGWVSGLQLAALSLRQREDARGFVRAFAGDHRHVFDLMVEEVLNGQPESVRTFLVQTSILERLSGPLCDAVTGRGDGRNMLEMLERRNLFVVPLDDERRWYRYHRLFADALRTLLQRSRPDEERSLHRKASAWYRDCGLLSEGVRHALAAHDFELAASTIELYSPGTPNPSIGVMDVRNWLQALPDDLVRSRPKCSILRAWELAGRGQLSAAEARLRDAERCLGVNEGATFQNAAMDPRALTAEIRRVLVDMAIARAVIADYQGDFSSALAISDQASQLSEIDNGAVPNPIQVYLGLAYWRSGDLASASRVFASASLSGRIAGNITSAIVNLVELAGIQAARGQLREAARTYEQALRIMGEQGGPSLKGYGALYVGLGRVLYEWNDLDSSAVQVAKGIELSEQSQMTVHTLDGYGALARLKQARGDTDGAHEALQRAEQLALVLPQAASSEI